MDEKPTYKELVDRVKRRFDGNNDDPPPREHYRVTTSEMKSSDQEATVDRIRTFTEKNRKLTDAKEQKLSKQVQRMLVKSKAVGNRNLAEPDRLYLLVNFTETSESRCIFIPAFQTVGVVLEWMASQYPREAFGAVTRPEGVTLQCRPTENTAPFIAKHQRIDTVLEQGQEIDVFVSSISDERYTTREEEPPSPLVHEDTSDVTPEAASSIIHAMTSPEDTPLHQEQTQTQEEAQEQVIEEEEENKQEDPSSFSVTVTQGKEVYTIYGVQGSMTIREFKDRVREVTGVAPHMQKLLYKGVLKDAERVENTPIRPGAKIALMMARK